jgi:hypothetical protein
MHCLMSISGLSDCCWRSHDASRQHSGNWREGLLSRPWAASSKTTVCCTIRHAQTALMVLCVYVFSDADVATLHQPNSVVNVATSLAAKPPGGDGPSPHQSSHSHPSSVSLASAHIIDVLAVSRSVTCTCHHGILTNVVSLGIMDQVELAPELVACFTGTRT